MAMHFSVSLTEHLAVIVERASGSSPVEATKFPIRVKTIASIKVLILMEQLLSTVMATS